MKPRLGRWIEYVPAALLVAVAASQLILVYVADLSPWVGGGFGMFASTDSRGYRHLHVTELRRGLEREVFLPDDLRDAERRARSLPTRANLERIADALLARSRAPRPRMIRVEAWKTHFEPETLIPRSRLLRAVEVSAPEEE